MKLKAPDAAAATALLPINWFLGICLSAFLTTVFASIAAPQPRAGELNPTEEWVVAQVRAGEIADLSEPFPDEEKEKRKLSAHFLEDLLTGTLSDFKPHRNGVRIGWAIIDEPIDLTNAQIPCDVCLLRCQFNSSAVFSRATFAGAVVFAESTFKADADFSGMKVRQNAAFSGAVFQGGVDFTGADIAGEFKADKTYFENAGQESRLGMKVAGAAFFRKAIFEAPVIFESAEFGSALRMDEAQFKNTQWSGSFNSMKVKGAFFPGAVFEGPVNFVGVDITDDFEATDVQFRSKTGTIWRAMKCGGTALFENATFTGPVSFADTSFLDLKIVYTNPDAPPLPQLDLSGGVIKRQLLIQNIEIDRLVARSLHVEGEAKLDEVTVTHSADLSHGEFATLDLSKTVWPEQPTEFQMQGLSYKNARAAPKERDSHNALLNLANKSAYSADVYGNLEGFFARQGYRDDADRAFIAGKRRERGEYLHGLAWFGSWILDLLSGYGRHTGRIGGLCVFWVALGCLLFSPKKMEPQKPEDAARVYSRFWYSLGLFLPFVDLQADKVWKPKSDQTFLRNYMRVHIILGWILIPIVLAALTGLIK
jgi:uncharacterized protein YjbI with pentapeptide repeats